METGGGYGEQRRALVVKLQSEGVLRSVPVISAMQKVPRELFVPEDLRRYAYNDVPLPTEHGQTISAPHDPLRNGSDETWWP